MIALGALVEALKDFILYRVSFASFNQIQAKVEIWWCGLTLVISRWTFPIRVYQEYHVAKLNNGVSYFIFLCEQINKRVSCLVKDFESPLSTPRLWRY